MMMARKKMWGLTALVAASLVFMAWLAGLLHFGKIAPGTVTEKAPPLSGRVFTVQEVELPQELTVLGSVVSRSLTQVAAQVSGKVSRIWVEAGSRVLAGDPLVALKAPEFAAKVKQAQAAAAQAQAHLAQTAADYRRYLRLVKEGAVSPQEFQAMEARHKSAQAALTQAQAQVQEAGTFKDYTLIKAPQQGVVAERRVAVGDVAQPGQPLITLYDPQQLQIEGEVNDSHRDLVKVGLTVRASVPAVNYQGELSLAEVFPISAEGSRTFRVRTAMIREAEVVPGMFARLEIPLGASRGILIPAAAVRQVGQLDLVEAVVDGRAVRRQVKLGRQMGDKVEVLAGLQAGDRILY